MHVKFELFLSYKYVEFELYDKPEVCGVECKICSQTCNADYSNWYDFYMVLCLIHMTFHVSIRLRGTTQGANNRMDLLALLTSGVNDNEVNGPDEDILGVVERWEEDETHNPDVPAISHKRGLTPFVFVSFEEVSLSFTFVRRSPFFHIKQKEDPGSHLTISI